MHYVLKRLLTTLFLLTRFLILGYISYEYLSVLKSTEAPISLLLEVIRAKILVIYIPINVLLYGVMIYLYIFSSKRKQVLYLTFFTIIFDVLIVTGFDNFLRVVI
jgi:hypothetical protein